MSRRLYFMWGCHQCGRMEYSLWGTWVARRRSIRHERREHGASVYDRSRT